MKAKNIKWYIDLEEGETYTDALEEYGLSTEVKIPDGMTDIEEISDWLSAEYGFCHVGFRLTR